MSPSKKNLLGWIKMHGIATTKYIPFAIAMAYTLVNNTCKMRLNLCSRYILKINILVCNTDDNSELNSQIESMADAFACELERATDGKAAGVSYQYVSLDTNRNIGRCKLCNAWVSDSSKEGFIQELSNGAFIDDAWLCDLCLPKDHPNEF